LHAYILLGTLAQASLVAGEGAMVNLAASARAKEVRSQFLEAARETTRNYRRIPTMRRLYAADAMLNRPDGFLTVGDSWPPPGCRGRVGSGTGALHRSGVCSGIALVVVFGGRHGDTSTMGGRPHGMRPMGWYGSVGSLEDLTTPVSA